MAIRKLRNVQCLSPTVCDLMKVILDVGQPTLIQRDGADKYTLPTIDTALLEQVPSTLQESKTSVAIILQFVSYNYLTKFSIDFEGIRYTVVTFWCC